MLLLQYVQLWSTFDESCAFFLQRGRNQLQSLWSRWEPNRMLILTMTGCQRKPLQNLVSCVSLSKCMRSKSHMPCLDSILEWQWTVTASVTSDEYKTSYSIYRLIFLCALFSTHFSPWCHQHIWNKLECGWRYLRKSLKMSHGWHMKTLNVPVQFLNLSKDSRASEGFLLRSRKLFQLINR